MNFKYLGEGDFEDIWAKFIVENDNASWRYLSKWREYQKIYNGSTFLKDLSFIILVENVPVSICPLFLEKVNGHKQFSFANGYQIAPLIKKYLQPKHRKKIENHCFAKIDELAQKYKVSKAMVHLDPGSEKYDFNVLTLYGFFDSSINTNIVDLSLDKKELWSNLRKSFKSLINNGKNKLRVHIMDYNNYNFEIHEEYRKLHHKVAGRVTRHKKTFDLQFDMLENDNAILIGLQDKDMFVAFSYFFHHNNNANYASSSDDPDYDSNIPLEHCIIWSAIEYYKKRNFNYLEIGWQNYANQIFDHPNQKDVNISFFKGGFGGGMFSLYRGIKYYNKDFMKKDLEHHVRQVLIEYTI